MILCCPFFSHLRGQLLAGLLSLATVATYAEQVERPAKPTLYLIGDSTVRCGRGNGEGGMYGWGQVLAPHFDTAQINVVNKAIGGRSSRTFLTEGRWREVLEQLQPGDFVLMQFGHNDGGEMFNGSRPRASIKGNGDETREGVVEATGKPDVVHSYGWYLRKYCENAKQHGATPIVLSQIPRDRWQDGKVIRASNDYGKWAREAAEQADALFVDLNEIVSQRYEQDGQVKVHADYFTPQDHTHTSLEGALVNAECVADGISQLDSCELRDYLLPPDQVPAREDGKFTVKRFDFGAGEVARGYYPVTADMTYTPERGYGFEPTIKVENASTDDDPLAGDVCQSDKPFYFSVDLPEGNYRVSIATPRVSPSNPVTVKAELRRLMVERSAEPTHEIIVNLRRPELRDGGQVRLKGREKTTEAWAWDNRLTLEFNGPQPAVASVIIEPADDAPTVFLAGDSTVADQPREPWNSWGQMLPRFFQPSVAVANHSESGETVRGSLGAHRFDKIFESAQPDDYLFIQFGHNDMKIKDADALEQYRRSLEQLVERARAQGVHPVLVTSMERLGGAQHETLGKYPQTVRQVAADLDVPLIDLNSQSRLLYRALGDNLDRAFVDKTHHTSYGSYLLARKVVADIRSQLPSLAPHLTQDAPYGDEGVIPYEEWKLPASPTRDLAASESS
ncbi:rhamnogalacturonan acetylesterase [Aeoliella sp. ICT_H6.2]|uniref:Rhamnogalacturonan acetylesterase n=1 Tax=Aeoliella straminimaris TaxID=2954799 RepID=A0A9X2F846_9BACT|nr:rhamnogalacturonan acetylesterase [Aeoliella straminimaris]MCO6044105.1 rhamnogalacturonan acetylesterase [Aeoliella straminimaris]